MHTALDTLTGILGDVTDLDHTASLLEWDEQVKMPPGGATTRGHMTSTIRRLAHERFTADDVGALIEQARAETAGADPSSTPARLLTVTARDYDKARRVPAAFVAEQARVLSASQHAWIDARAASRFEAFRPHLERVIELKRQYVSFFPPGAHPYDVLLDDYEPGTTTAEIQALFEALRPRQVALIRAIAERPAVDDRCLRARWPEADLDAFSREVVTALGFDWTRGRQDRSVHPFATGIGPHDVRITTRYVEQEPLSLLFGALHETGHALYEQGIDPAVARTPLGRAVSLGIHESQSRLWENLVARSRPFWQHFFPALRARFASALGDTDLDAFYKAINRVQRSLIRVEADEATYNLHVMLRVEIEIALIEGRLAVADLPEVWRTKMREYLDLDPPDDARGVLQDIHWSGGLLGYFPTYTLGNVVSAQLWDAFGREHPARDLDIARGDFATLLGWLREQVHRHGRMLTPQQLVERATGSPIDPEPYLAYLEEKYGEIYGI
ncbi:MAG: carboxypeptidase M32 [Acidimicrobiia bacterium]|nr:carboxypeptidase M32 [Acidimicrobiia bacterium]